MRRFGLAGLGLVWLALFGCSAGQPSQGFVEPRLMVAYIPLSISHDLIFSNWGAALALTPSVAVTNDHNLNLIPEGRLLARSRDYDLLFFRSDAAAPASVGKARIGEDVIAYGQGRAEMLRQARGRVALLAESVPARCDGCPIQQALVFDANAGEGFSGGPVVDAGTGAVLGIVFGYLDRSTAEGGRRMYAYDIALVLAEMHRLLDRAPQP